MLEGFPMSSNPGLSPNSCSKSINKSNGRKSYLIPFEVILQKFNQNRLQLKILSQISNVCTYAHTHTHTHKHTHTHTHTHKHTHTHTHTHKHTHTQTHTVGLLCVNKIQHPVNPHLLQSLVGCGRDVEKILIFILR